jgi:hypothetical protein
MANRATARIVSIILILAELEHVLPEDVCEAPPVKEVVFDCQDCVFKEELGDKAQNFPPCTELYSIDATVSSKRSTRSRTWSRT